MPENLRRLLGQDRLIRNSPQGALQTSRKKTLTKPFYQHEDECLNQVIYIWQHI